MRITISILDDEKDCTSVTLRTRDSEQETYSERRVTLGKMLPSDALVEVAALLEGQCFSMPAYRTSAEIYSGTSLYGSRYRYTGTDAPIHANRKMGKFKLDESPKNDDDVQTTNSIILGGII